MSKLHEISETGPGWAVLNHDGKVKKGRWATKRDAHEYGLLRRYLLSGSEVVEVLS